MISIFGAPSRYIQGPGAIDQLAALSAPDGKCPAIIVDADVLPFIEKSLEAGFAGKPHVILPFRGEVTRPAIAALAADAGKAGVDLVIGIGGGKGLDIAKGVARTLGLRFASVPSIASNDSPTGRAMAIYDDDHVLVAIDTMEQHPVFVLADTTLIAQAPARFLRSGIGDAIAKKFEAERAAADGSTNFFGAKATHMALAIGDACYKTLRRFGVAGMAAAEAHRPDEAFEAVVEANVLMSGLAWENGGLSFAHAVVRGLARARGIKAMPHGEHVAYATLVQLAIERRDDAYIRDVIGFLVDVGLPTTLAALGMDDATAVEIDEIAHLTTIGPAGGIINVSANEREIAAAIRRIEALAA